MRSRTRQLFKSGTQIATQSTRNYFLWTCIDPRLQDNDIFRHIAKLAFPDGLVEPKQFTLRSAAAAFGADDEIFLNTVKLLEDIADTQGRSQLLFLHHEQCLALATKAVKHRSFRQKIMSPDGRSRDYPRHAYLDFRDSMIDEALKNETLREMLRDGKLDLTSGIYRHYWTPSIDSFQKNQSSYDPSRDLVDLWKVEIDSNNAKQLTKLTNHQQSVMPQTQQQGWAI